MDSDYKVDDQRNSSPDLYACFRSIFYQSHFPLFMLSNHTGIEQLFVEPTAKYEELGSTRFQLVEKLMDVLKPSKFSAFSVVGQSGIGKTSTALRLTDQLWSHPDSERNFVLPIYIPLRQLELAAESMDESASNGFDIVRVYLQMNESVFNDVRWTYSVLKRQWRLILIMDGYDEMFNRNYNFWETNRWIDEFHATSVSTVVFCKNLQISNSKLKENFKFESKLDRSVIQPEIFEMLEFESNKVDLLIGKSVAFLKSMDGVSSGKHDPWAITKTYTQGTDWEKDPELYQTWFRTILPALSQVAKTPFILIMIVQMLPRIVQENNLEIEDACDETMEVIEKICATELQIYTNFVDFWFAFYQEKAESDKVITSIPGFVKKIPHYFEAYATNLSTVLLFQNQGFLTDGLLSESDTLKWDLWVPRCGDEVLNASLLKFAESNDIFATSTVASQEHQSRHVKNLKKLRDACFIRKVNDGFKFLHTSIIEYFGSREIFGGLRSQLDQIIQNRTGTSTFSFNTHKITDQQFSGVLTFLIQKTKEDVEFYETLKQCVQLSAEIYGLQRLASNAITVMNMAGIPLPVSLKNVQIPEANLGKCIAGNVDFSGANLSGTVLTQCWAPFVDLSGANLSNCIIGHGTPLRVFTNCPNVTSMTTLGNEFVVCSYINKEIWRYSMSYSRNGEHKFEIPACEGERQEKLIHLASLKNGGLLVAKLGHVMVPLGGGAQSIVYRVDKLYLYDGSGHLLRDIGESRSSDPGGKQVSILFENSGGGNAQETQEKEKMKADEEKEEEEERKESNDDKESGDLTVKQICFAENNDEFGLKFRDSLDHILEIFSYDLGEADSHLVVLQSATKRKVNKDRLEMNSFETTYCDPLVGGKLLITSTPARYTIYSNRNLQDFQWDFNSTEDPTVSLSFLSKKRIVVFLVNLVTLEWKEASIGVPKFQYYSLQVTMFSPNGKYFVVHTTNPNIYLRETNEWVSVDDNVTKNDNRFTSKIDDENRFLAFSRHNYIAVCSLQTGIIFQKISRLMIGAASFSFFTDRYSQLCLIYQNGSAIESTQVAENTNVNRFLHQGDASYDVMCLSNNGRTLVACFDTENGDSECYTLMRAFDVDSSTVHARRNLIFETFAYSIASRNSIGFYKEFLFVDDCEEVKIWNLTKKAKPIKCPRDLSAPQKVYFLDKIELLVCMGENDTLRCFRVDEDADGNVVLSIVKTIPFPNASLGDNVRYNCLPYLDMNDPNIVYFCGLSQGLVPMAILDLEEEFIKATQFEKDPTVGVTSTNKKFCFDLKLGEVNDSNDPVILYQRESLPKFAQIQSYDWSYEESVIAVALPGRCVQLMDMDFQILFQFHGFYEISGVKLLSTLFPTSQLSGARSEAYSEALSCDLLIWNASGSVTRLSDISTSPECPDQSKWRIVSTQSSSDSLCLTKAALNQCHKTTNDYDGLFGYNNCTGSPSVRRYQSYPALFKEVLETDKSIFPSNKTKMPIDLTQNWSIFVVSKEVPNEYFPVSTIDNHVALIIEGMRRNRHFVIRAELTLNYREKFEIKMQSIDEMTALSQQQYISCGWEKDPATVLKLIDEIWNDKHKFEDDRHEYHTVYNNCCKYIQDKLESIGIQMQTLKVFGRKVYLPWDMMRRINKEIGYQHLIRIGLWFLIAYSRRHLSTQFLMVSAFWILALIVALVSFAADIN